MAPDIQSDQPHLRRGKVCVPRRHQHEPTGAFVLIIRAFVGEGLSLFLLEFLLFFSGYIESDIQDSGFRTSFKSTPPHPPQRYEGQSKPTGGAFPDRRTETAKQDGSVSARRTFFRVRKIIRLEVCLFCSPAPLHLIIEYHARRHRRRVVVHTCHCPEIERGR